MRSKKIGIKPLYLAKRNKIKKKVNWNEREIHVRVFFIWLFVLYFRRWRTHNFSNKKNCHVKYFYTRKSTIHFSFQTKLHKIVRFDCELSAGFLGKRKNLRDSFFLSLSSSSSGEVFFNTFFVCLYFVVIVIHLVEWTIESFKFFRDERTRQMYKYIWEYV